MSERSAAVDGADAIEKLYSPSFDLVLTGIDVDGYEFIRQVRSNGDRTDLPPYSACF